MRTKITVVGAGNVGATLAQRVAERDYADIVLVDIVEGLPQGKALDMLEFGPIDGYDSLVTGTNGYEETAGSQIVVITSGVPRKPGMSRDDLVMTNAKIVSGVVREVVTQSPDCILIVVANPVDGMTQLSMAVSRLPALARHRHGRRARHRALTARSSRRSSTRRCTTCRRTCSAATATRWCRSRGSRPLPAFPAADLIPAERLETIVQRARDGGAEIVNLLKTGSAYYAPSAAVAQMIDAIVLDTRQVLPCTVHLEGEYGINGLFTGVPCRLGAGGLIEVVDVALTDDERAALHRSAEAVHQVVRGDGRAPRRRSTRASAHSPTGSASAEQHRRRDLDERVDHHVRMADVARELAVRAHADAAHPRRDRRAHADRRVLDRRRMRDGTTSSAAPR